MAVVTFLCRGIQVTWGLWLLALLIGVAVDRVRGVPAGFGLDTALFQAQTDPLGEVDIFQSLSPKIKRILSYPSGSDKMTTLRSLESTTLITVKLVGFSNDDRSRLSHLEAQLASYMDALNQDMYVSVIGHESHRLMVKTRVTVEVIKAPNNLADKIHAAIANHLDTDSKGKLVTTEMRQVAYEVVDQIVRTDLDNPLSSYTIYLLNLKPQPRHKYAYVLSERGPFGYMVTCLGTFWTGKERYMWVDLAAGPVEYGPSTSGEGYVKGELLPSASSYAQSQQNTFAADLASVVWSATRMLFVPAVQIPVTYFSELEVHFINIRQGELKEKGLNFQAMEDTFLKESKDGLLFSHQNLKFKHATIILSECPACSAAFARAYRTYTARLLLDKYAPFLEEYLDSKQLHSFLSEFGAELAENSAGLKRSDLSTRVVPVYIFDLDTDRQILIDRYHQVMPFPDMVIAVRTSHHQAVSEYSCNGRPLLQQSMELERPITGALLQSLFGVAPTHLTWSPEHNSTLVDYLWGLGQTPFGPFSNSVSLSFAQRDAARRNTIITMLNHTLGSAVDLLESIKIYGGEKKLLDPKQHLEFSQRWNLIIYKLTRVMLALTHFEFDTALYFLKSSEHDLFAAHRLAYTASTDMEARMTCFVDPPFPWGWVFVGMGMLTVAFYVWLKREKLFVNKKKRF